MGISLLDQSDRGRSLLTTDTYDTKGDSDGSSSSISNRGNEPTGDQESESGDVIVKQSESSDTANDPTVHNQTSSVTRDSGASITWLKI